MRPVEREPKLEQPPPRERRAAESALKQSRRVSRIFFVAGPVLGCWVMLPELNKWPEVSPGAVAGAASLAAFVAYFGLASNIIIRKSVEVFVHGILLEGELGDVRHPMSLFILADVSFTDPMGVRRHGKVLAPFAGRHLPFQEGQTVPVLYRAKPLLVGVYSAHAILIGTRLTH